MICIAPSILAANWSILEKELHECESLGISHIHFDIMDGNFVPNISFGPKFIADLRKKFPTMFFDVHLMVRNPTNYVQMVADAGADACTVHFEEERFLFRCFNLISSHNMKIGVAINPQTPVESISEVLSLLDIVVVMSVDPGFGGQKFIQSSLKKIQTLHAVRTEQNLKYRISVDGGVNYNTAKDIIKSGADILVAGSAFFTSENKQKLITDITN